MMRNKTLKNQKIRIAMIQNNIKQYEVAKLLGIHESVLCRKLREELPDEKQDEIVSKILKKAEQEPCTDAVSRKAVCDYIAEFINSEFDLMIRCIKHLPSVTQKSGEWIPVSERLPELMLRKGGLGIGDYLCSDAVLICVNEPIYDLGKVFIGYYEADYGWADFNATVSTPINAVAWMPLPEPYREEGDYE